MKVARFHLSRKQLQRPQQTSTNASPYFNPDVPVNKIRWKKIVTVFFERLRVGFITLFPN